MDQFEKVIKEGYTFEMSKYLNEGWETFKKEAGSFIGYTILVYIISFVIAFLPFVSVVNTIVQYCLYAGAIIFIRKMQTGKQEFGDFFQGFNFFGQFFLYGLLLLLFMLPLLGIVFGFIFPFDTFIDVIRNGSDPEYIFYELQENIEGGVMFGISIFLVLIGIIYIYTSYSLVIPLIADAKLQFWQAMETSRKTVAKNFFSFLIFYFLLGLIMIFGVALTCGLGLLVATPFMLAVQFSVYDNILKPTHDDLSSQVAGFGQSTEDTNTESEDENKIE